MRIIVCVKEVIDTVSKVYEFKWTRGKESDLIDFYLKQQQNLKEGKIDLEESKLILNPNDEFAIEEALRIKEKFPDTEITLISLGPKSDQKALKTGLAMGANNAIQLIDPVFNGLDNLNISRVLAKTIQSMPFDLVLCGKQAVDDDMSQVGASMAVLLGIPFVSYINKLELSEDCKQGMITRTIDSGFEVIEAQLPLLLNCQKGLNIPRSPSMKGIMAARKKEIKLMNAKSIGYGPYSIDSSSNCIKEINLALPQKKKKGRILEGPIQKIIPELVNILKEEEEVI